MLCTAYVLLGLPHATRLRELIYFPPYILSPTSTSLQSKECQKRHWQYHRRDCNTSRECRKQIDSLSLTRNPHPNDPPPSQILDEIHSFREHFTPALMFAASNAFCEAENSLMPERLWRDHIFVCHINRIPHASPSSPGWSRFTVKSSAVMSVQSLRGPNHQELARGHRTKKRDESITKSLSEGCGVITIQILCGYRGLGLQSFTDFQFGLGVPMGLLSEIVGDWRALLVKEVRESCSVWWDAGEVE